MPLSEDILRTAYVRLLSQLDISISPLEQMAEAERLVAAGLFDEFESSPASWVESADEFLQMSSSESAPIFAAAFARQALRLIEGKNDDSLRASAWWSIAEAHQSIFDFAGTSDAWAAAAAAFRSSGYALGLLHAVMSLGATQLVFGRLDGALAAYDEAIDLLGTLIKEGQIELREMLAGAHQNRGSALRRQGRMDESLVDLAEAISLFRALGGERRTDLRADLAGALTNQGNTLANQGRLAESLTSHREAVGLVRALVREGRTDLRADLANAVMSEGIVLAFQGQLDEALTLYAEAIMYFRTLIREGQDEVRVDLANAVMNQGNALDDQERLAEALSAFAEAVALRRTLIAEGRTEQRAHLALALLNQGRSLANQGQLAESLTSSSEAIEHLRTLIIEGRTELQADLAKAYLSHGTTLVQQEQFAAALAWYTEGTILLRRLVKDGWTQLRVDLAGSLDNSGLAYSSQGQLDEALSAHADAIALFQTLVREGQIEVLVELARAMMNRGAVLAEQGRHDEAFTAYAEAISLCQDAGEAAIDTHWRVLYNRAHLQRRTNQPIPAADSIAEAIPLVERLAGRIPTLTDRLHLRESVLDVYRLAALLAAERGDRAGAFLSAQHAKGRALAELRSVRPDDYRNSPERRLAELTLADFWTEAHAGDAGHTDPHASNRSRADRNAERAALIAQLTETRPERALLTVGAVKPLPEIAAALHPDEALLDLFDVRVSVVLTILLPDRTEPAWLGSVDKTALTEALDAWDRALAFPGDSLLWDIALKTMGEALFADCLPVLRAAGVRRLIISPSGRTHRFPFAAVIVPGEDGAPRYLSDLFMLSLIPTATSLCLMRQEERATWPPALVAAAPFAGKQAKPIRGRSRAWRADEDDALPGTVIEARAVADLVRQSGGSTTPAAVLLGADATRPATLNLLPGAKLVLLATHGRQPDAATGLLDYQLLFHPSPDSPDHLLVREVFSGSLPLPDVFQVCLTACHLGEVVLQGEEALGFAQAFLSAGAGVVLAPLWAVNDAATCALSIAYHEALLSDAHPTVAEAWQSAMATIRSHSAWSHPFFWSGFLPNGDGALRLQDEHPAKHPSAASNR
jgi:CHAT domain-containing protein